MNFKDIPYIAIEYRNKIDDVAKDFYLPVLSEATVYKRAVGYFSSEILIKISKGLGKLIKNGGIIQLLISPKLSSADYEIFKNNENQLIEQVALENLYDLIDQESKDRLSILYFLLASKKMTVKFALVKETKFGIYHEKLGILKDLEGNLIAFTGSANETGAALDDNYEAIDVFRSWANDSDFERCAIKEVAFDNLWNERDKSIKTVDISQLVKEKLLKYKNDEDSYVLDVDEYYLNRNSITVALPFFPNGKNFFDYQLSAIQNWKDNNFVGIYDMATGTGKTFTALGSIVKLFEEKKRIFVIIVVPYIHLVDQWNEEAEAFNIHPLLIYSENKNWRDIVKRKIAWFKLKQSNFDCLITTNASFSNEYLQEQLDLIKAEVLIIVDEAHNAGAMKLSESLNTSFQYRLALSATIDRHNDDEGTSRIYKYFDKKVISIDIGQAIQKGFLTPYEYYPIIVNLTDEEREEYYLISEKISKIMARGGYDNLSKKNKEIVKILSLKRSRIVAGAKNKLLKLSEIIEEKFLNEKNLLIYCGAVIYKDHVIEEDYHEDLRQIDLVVKELGKNKGMIVSRFTSLESKQKRQEIKEAYMRNDLQALVAIKCLDEGVNIPAIKTAFILASSSNPREYIQRRGRVLRRFPGKINSVIFDFITIARPFTDNIILDDTYKNIEANLVLKELSRIKEFAQLSKNPSKSNAIINEIESHYDLNSIKIEKEGDFYE